MSTFHHDFTVERDARAMLQRIENATCDEVADDIDRRKHIDDVFQACVVAKTQREREQVTV